MAIFPERRFPERRFQGGFSRTRQENDDPGNVSSGKNHLGNVSSGKMTFRESYYPETDCIPNTHHVTIKVTTSNYSKHCMCDFRCLFLWRVQYRMEVPVRWTLVVLTTVRARPTIRIVFRICASVDLDISKRTHSAVSITIPRFVCVCVCVCVCE